MSGEVKKAPYARFLARTVSSDGMVCEECASRVNLHRHHDDYLKPLEVRFMCASCHKKWHKVNGPGANKRMKTMTLNLADQEMEAIDKMSKEKEMSKTAVIRQALRMYSSINWHLGTGGRVQLLDSAGKSILGNPVGCGWGGMD